MTSQPTPRVRTVEQARREAGLLGKLGPNGRKLCLCGTELPKYRRSWCSDKCSEEFHWNMLRIVIFRRDKGVCAECRLDTIALKREYDALTLPNEPGHAKFWDQPARRKFLEDHGIPPGRSCSDWWDADHILPLIEGGANPGDLVLDPFGGIGTVGVRAILAGRRTYTIELSPEYWHDSLGYLNAAEMKVNTPTLFDAIEVVGA